MRGIFDPAMRMIWGPTKALIPFVLLLGCSQPQHRRTEPRQGYWRVEMDLNGRVLPFQLELIKQDSAQWSARVHNASEMIRVSDVHLRGDSLTIHMPLFDSELKGTVVNDSLIRGHWHNYLKGPEYTIPFVAHAGVRDRFTNARPAEVVVDGKWEVHFSKGSNDGYNAIGLFQQEASGRLTGTFVTETGDYRYLEGVVDGDSARLSCFDGSHAFLFTAGLEGDSLVGRYWSGTHWQEPWVAYRNAAFQLRNPDSLTFLKEGYEMVDFNFPDLEGTRLSPTDERFRGKVLMVQIMGSWCPNCVDETVLLKELHDTYGGQGLEVIAVAFEKYPEEGRAIGALKRFRETMGVNYPIVYGGSSSKQAASSQLPFLDHVMSFPTCIFVDRGGKVRRIRTGFYGPSTGEHYENYRRNLRTFVESLLAEPVSGPDRKDA